MKKITSKQNHTAEMNNLFKNSITDSALWKLENIEFEKVDGWWQYQREDGLTCWELDGGPFKTLKEAKEKALKSLEEHPLNK